MKYGPQIGKATQKREKQQWAIEKIILERLRGIYFIDPEDGEDKETIEKTRKSWKFQWMRQYRARKEQRNTSRVRKLKRNVVNPTRFQRQSMHV